MFWKIPAVFFLIAICFINCHNSRNNIQKKYPIISHKLDTLFHFWETGNFDSLYCHLDELSKSTHSKESFLKKYSELYQFHRVKVQGITKYKIVNDTTFLIFFSCKIFEIPNSVNLIYSKDSIANTFQFRKCEEMSWTIIYQKGNVFLSLKEIKKKHRTGASLV